MNCPQFEEVVLDLARGCAVEEPVHAHAAEHSQSCSRCAARLAEEQALNAMLHLPDPSAAPGHIEDALLSAYRERFGPVVPAPRARRPVSAGMLALAASMLLMLAGSVTYMMLHAPGPENPKQSKSIAVNARPQSVAARPEIKEAEISKPVVAVNSAPVPPVAAGRSVPEEASAQSEIASDFIALTSSAEISTMESGQIVRVLLPRSAMASYGLPFNQERADVPVSAQVLIGQDGVARAIRFLSDSKTNLVQTGLHSKR